ncbi:MAG TPA: VWA domain-containing protein [Thermoanaerobaculia bacterium]|nr:VWA domain-containing protein [Thermoanaerobaculia bacterium]
MRKTLITTFLAALAIATTAVAQQQPAPPPAPQAALTEKLEIRVINVDVTVTDRKGNAVKGLTKDDFEILENGRSKPISNFYEVTSPVKSAAGEVKPGETSAPQPAVRAEDIPDNQKRRIIFYIDNLSLNPFNRNRVFKEMKKFIDEAMRPGDEAMIATYNRSMKVRVPFTRDKITLQQTLDVILGESALGVNAKSDRTQTEDQIRDANSYGEALSYARSYSEEIQHDLRQSVESINALMTTLAGVEGKKVLVLTSEGFPMQPGREMFAFLDDTAKDKGWQTGGTLLEGMSYDSHEQIADIARSANANGITMYTIHAAGLDASSTVSAESSHPISFTVAQAALQNSTDSMQMMAEMTGGLASLQTNDFGRAFDHIERDLDSYYSLGYRAGTERVDSQRNLQVRLKNNTNHYTVRSRQTFVEKSTFAEMNDRVVANLLYQSHANDLKIQSKAGQPRPADEDTFQVPVEVQIPMDSLTLLPQGDELAGGFDLFVVVSNKDGDMSDVARKTQQIRVPITDREKIHGKFYTYSMDLVMEPGPGKISIGVMDQVSNETGFSNIPVLVKDLR